MTPFFGVFEGWRGTGAAGGHDFRTTWQERAVLGGLEEFGRMAGDLAEVAVGVGAVNAGEGGEEAMGVWVQR